MGMWHTCVARTSSIQRGKAKLVLVRRIIGYKESDVHAVVALRSCVTASLACAAFHACHAFRACHAIVVA